jgi:hypothetical protein
VQVLFGCHLFGAVKVFIVGKMMQDEFVVRYQASRWRSVRPTKRGVS